MKKIWFLSILLLNGILLYAQDCGELLRTAREYRTAGEYKEALKYYREAYKNKECRNYYDGVYKEMKECEKIVDEMSKVFVLELPKLECEGGGGVLEVRFKQTPDSWSVLKKPEWIPESNVVIEEKKALFTINPNPNAEIRKGTIRLKSNKGRTWDFTVSQKEGEAQLRFYPEDLSFGGGGGQQTVDVEANFDWKYSTSAPWIRLSKKDNKLLVTCTTNELALKRTDTVFIIGKNVRQPILVTQFEDDMYFSITGVANNVISFEAEGGNNGMLRVICNEEWRLESDCPWLKVTSSKDNVVVQCEANYWSVPRTASFNLVTASNGQSKTILVEQAGAEPKLEKISFPMSGKVNAEERKLNNVRAHYRETQISGDGGLVRVKVYSNIPEWSYEILPEGVTWITAGSFQEDGQLKLFFSENNDWTDSRKASVVFMAQGVLQDTLVIKQTKRGYAGIVKDYFGEPEKAWKTTRFFVDLYALESIGFRIGGLAKRWKYVEFSLLDFDIEYAHKYLYLDWEPIVRGFLPVSRAERHWAIFMGMGISVNMLNLCLAPQVEFSYFGKPHFLFELGAEFQWRKKDNISSRIFYKYDGFSSFGISFDLYQWHSKFSRKEN